MPSRRSFHVCNFVFSFVVISVVVAVLTLLQGNGMLALSSERVIMNTGETLFFIGILAILATFLLIEFFLIGLPNLAILG